MRVQSLGIFAIRHGEIGVCACYGLRYSWRVRLKPCFHGIASEGLMAHEANGSIEINGDLMPEALQAEFASSVL